MPDRVNGHYVSDPRARSALLGLVGSDTSWLQGDGRTFFVPDPRQFFQGEGRSRFSKIGPLNRWGIFADASEKA